MFANQRLPPAICSLVSASNNNETNITRSDSGQRDLEEKLIDAMGASDESVPAPTCEQRPAEGRIHLMDCIPSDSESEATTPQREGSEALCIELESSTSEVAQCRYCLEDFPASASVSMCLCNGALCAECLKGELALTFGRGDGSMHCTVCKTPYVTTAASSERLLANASEVCAFCFESDLRRLTRGSAQENGVCIEPVSWRHLLPALALIYFWVFVAVPLLFMTRLKEQSVANQYFYRTMLVIVDMFTAILLVMMCINLAHMRPFFALHTHAAYNLRGCLLLLNVFGINFNEASKPIRVLCVASSFGVAIAFLVVFCVGVAKQWHCYTHPVFDPTHQMDADTLLRSVTTNVAVTSSRESAEV